MRKLSMITGPEAPSREDGLRAFGTLLRTGKIVKTENGIKLWVNSEKPILDAWVSDGQMKEHRISVRLLGGRAVPIALDFFKWKDKTASIELRWKPPHGVVEIIPRSRFMPKQSARVFTVQTPLPPDDSSHGFARGISVSKAWDEATTHGALETAARVVSHMDLSLIHI